MIKETLVLGASRNPHKYSYQALVRLKSKGQIVKAIGSLECEVESVKIVADKKKFKKIDTITLYLNPKNQIDYYDYIIELKPRRVIFNPGTENRDLEKLLIAHNIYFEKSCTLVLLATGQY